jgi:hypothetical protein
MQRTRLEPRLEPGRLVTPPSPVLSERNRRHAASELNKSLSNQDPTMKKSLRSRAGAFATATVLGLGLAPQPAHAAFDAGVVIAWATQALTVLQGNIGTWLQTIQSSLFEGMLDGTDKTVAAIEKNTGAQKELVQADLNYQAALVATQRAQKANDDFASPRASQYNRCQTANTSREIIGTNDNAQVSARGKTSADVRRTLYGDPADEAKKVFDDHKNYFCTTEDARRGRCDAAPPAMRGANMSAGSLLTPVAGDTYSADEARAAKSFITLATDPIVAGPLPPGLDRSPAGQRYRLESMAAAAQMSVAKHSLNQIMAARSAEGELVDITGGAAGEKLSIKGLMKKFVGDRFGNPNYDQDLATKGEMGLLREVAINLAAKNWMDYHQFSQGERIETLLAVQVAMATRERSERTLAEARAGASSARQ